MQSNSMPTIKPFVKSNYERRPNDHYPTIDDRAVVALNNSWDVVTPAIDPCVGTDPTPLWPATNGTFRDMKGSAQCVITNPPYKKGDVDLIMDTLITAVIEKDIVMLAALVRVQWDCAKTRRHMFLPPYAGCIRLQFRPWWSSDRKASPIHNYQWLIWDNRHTGEPIIRYHDGV